jgi:hypothetical protein
MLGADKKRKEVHDMWLGQPAGREIGWYHRIMAEMLAATRDPVKMMKEVFKDSKIQPATHWVEVTSLLAMALCLCLLMSYVDCVD